MSVDIINSSDKEVMVQLKYNDLSADNRFVVAIGGYVVYVPFYDPELHNNLVLEEDAYKYFVFEKA